MATHTIVPQQLKDVTEGWSKWDIALYVGAPIALGIAGLWYYNRSKSINKEKKASGDSKDKPQVKCTSGNLCDINLSRTTSKSSSKPQAQVINF